VAGLVLHHAATTGTYSAETPLRHVCPPSEPIGHFELIA
jgi:hypothetical protein